MKGLIWHDRQIRKKREADINNLIKTRRQFKKLIKKANEADNVEESLGFTQKAHALVSG